MTRKRKGIGRKSVGFIFDAKARENMDWILARRGRYGLSKSDLLMELLAEERARLDHKLPKGITGHKADVLFVDDVEGPVP